MTWSRRSRCLFSVLAALSACSPEPTAQTAAAVSRAPVTGDDTITLITGDRVQLTAGGAVIVPAPGRGAVTFAISREHDDIFVTPSDVAPRIAAHRLDRALFDVTRLLADGYGDRARADLPLIVEGSAGFAPAIAAGAIVDRVLPSAHAIAVRQPKGRALVAGGGRIWLDRKRRLTLDHSVPQIGGPAAHARGLTGAGVTVAVIDSGIDSTHPDLADRVIAAEDFTGDGGGVLDVFGHGTHVASIIAGTGAASGGQFAGVAPGAHLVSGRACDAFGDCTDSALLAAIEWAVVDQHAPIVNLSLGGSDTPELDPLEDLVNTLSAQDGTLFVISAGNDGGDGTINSPGSADAALTVGAVDRDDQLELLEPRPAHRRSRDQAGPDRAGRRHRGGARHRPRADRRGGRHRLPAAVRHLDGGAARRRRRRAGPPAAPGLDRRRAQGAADRHRAADRRLDRVPARRRPGRRRSRDAPGGDRRARLAQPRRRPVPARRRPGADPHGDVRQRRRRADHARARRDARLARRDHAARAARARRHERHGARRWPRQRDRHGRHRGGRAGRRLHRRDRRDRRRRPDRDADRRRARGRIVRHRAPRDRRRRRARRRVGVHPAWP